MGGETTQRTLAIIKPDAFSAGHCGAIIGAMQDNGFAMIGAKILRLTTDRAGEFYAVHRGKPFYGELVSFMSSGNIMVLALERENAIDHWRRTMGATDPAKAGTGTIRKRFGTTVSRNACHGSDGTETARTEISFFFGPEELPG